MTVSYLKQEKNSEYYRIYGEVEGITFESVALRKLEEISKAFLIPVLVLKDLIKK